MMKRIGKLALPVMASTLLTASCQNTATRQTETMKTNNPLTEAEKSAGILTPEVMWKMGRAGGSALSPDGNTVLYTVTFYDMAQNKGTTDIWSIPFEGGRARCLTNGAGNASSAAWSSDGSRIYYLSDRTGSSQLWSMAPDGSDPEQLSDIADGIEAFGVAPHGDRVYYVKRVAVEKHNAPDRYEDLPRSKAKIYDDLMARHWSYWDDGSYLHIFVAELKDGRMTEGRDIMPGEPWDAPTAPYFDASEIAWNNAGTQLAYTCKKLTGKAYATSTDSDIYLYDVAAGTTENLCKAVTNDREYARFPVGRGYDGVVLPGYDKYPRFSPDDSKIAFTSMERGGNESDKDRLMVLDLNTHTLSNPTADFDYNAANIRWADDNTLYFIAPIQATHQICRVSLERPDSVTVLTGGDHDLNAFSLAKDRIVAERTTLSSATELFSVDTGSGGLRQITETNKEIYDHIKMGEVRKRWVATTDGKQMLTWIVLPPDFDPSKKYPTLLYCQGGPQSVVSQFWSYRWNLQLMAAQGYIVVAPNRRGLPSFGQEWLDQISGDYSGQNIRDYLSAIDDAAREPWVDKDRLGCVGASYGGYSVYYLAGHHDNRFKAFIAHCGMFNFESMYASTEELWFPNNDLGGPYWSDNPTAERSYANSPHKAVRNWNTPILIIVGQNDYRIPYTESLQAFTAARLRGVPSRLVFFEDEGHQVFKPQNSLLWNREFFGWLDKYVKNPESATAGK